MLFVPEVYPVVLLPLFTHALYFLMLYIKQATGMMPMMNQLRIPSLGSHHLGIDDTKNIARVLQRMISDGAVLQVSARRNPRSPMNVEFIFKNRIV